jgi:hypothetical protein
MVHYNATQRFRTENNLHFFTFYTKADKPVEVLIKHFPGNISAENITVTLKDMKYDVINVKEMTAKRATLEGVVTHTSLPLFTVTLARNKISLVK